MNLLTELFGGRQERKAVALHTSDSGVTIDPVGVENFKAYVEYGLKQNGIIWACLAARSWVYADVAFKFQRPDGTLFGTPALSILERPWPGGSTRKLLKRIEGHVSLQGNAYVNRANPNLLQVLRPDWVDIILDQFGTVQGYLFYPGGKTSGNEPVVLLQSEVAHVYDTEDPLNAHKGMSWLTPVIREIEADKRMTKHRDKFFENAATPNLLVTVEGKIATKEARDKFRNELDRKFGGLDNAYKSLILDEGADAKVIGSTMEQLSFTTTQAGGENRITTAARVPPIVVGIREGLQAATYSNYAQAMRAFADHTISPKWGETAEGLSNVVRLPNAGNDGSKLWFDASRVAALQQDQADQADIDAKNAQAIRTLVDAGFVADTAVQAVITGDFRVLEHSDLFSVQLQPPGSGEPNGQSDDN